MKLTGFRLILLLVTFGLTVVNWFLYSHLQSVNAYYTELPITVSIVGAVRHPGVYKLQPGSLISDLLRISGGLNTNADIAAFVSNINLSSELSNYQKINISAKNQANPSSKPELALVNINSATEKELQNLPGIGEVIAKRIVDARPIKSHAELMQVQGVTQSILDRIANLVTY